MSHSSDEETFRPARHRANPLRKRLIPLAITGSVVLAGVGVHSAFATPSADAVISEVYGGGGNSGATFTNDFIELANAGAGTLDLSDYTVQYLSGNPGPTTKWQATRLTGSLAGNGRYLIQEAAGTGGTTTLPTPDATGNINMSGTTGTVALVKGTDLLTCVTAEDCAADSRVKDLVGFGTAVVHEGSGAAAGASNTESVARKTLVDTDDNAADFAAGAPTPENSGGAGGGTGDDGSSPSPSPTATPPADAISAKIHDIQGTTRRSPLATKDVKDVTGIVTGVRTTSTSSTSKGFWMQDPKADKDPRTSEGIFVYTSSNPTVKVGDSVSVAGVVSEYYPGGYDSGIQSITEIIKPIVTVLSSGNALPAPVVLTKKNIPTAWSPAGGSDGSIDNLELEPTKYALDFYESLEGMNVQISDAGVVGATDAYKELWVSVDPKHNKTKRGGTYYPSYDDPNSTRLQVQAMNTSDAFPMANVGDTLKGVTEGPLDYSQYAGTYILEARTLGTYVDNGLKPQVAAAPKSNEVAIATYNVENLAPTDAQSKFDRLAKGLVTNLRAPGIVALEEIQDNNGAVDDGTVDADKTLNKLTAAIAAAGGPQYSWRQISPQNDKDGGQPGGNIRTAFLFDPTQVSFVDWPGGDATTAVDVTGKNNKTSLTVSPGRITPNDEAWNSSRKPMVGQFLTRNNKTIFVIANHFNSKGGDQNIAGRIQEPVRSSEVQRMKQAMLENAFVKKLEAADSKALIVSLGDFNDYQFSPALNTLTGNGTVLTDMINTLPKEERYSYVFQGNSQVLDHILVNPTMLGKVSYEVVHINSEFADQTSDHDPQVLRLKP
ncbi:lamin tail domain-containing protein [Streptomyces nodosus]|uniref:lamin tail domain-containing protein n=1 Tax=Streptomyces nodosus TaxID=40318 RepID=UPI000AD6E8F5|nr:endonuclease/exonuclease/phosphatase family protein [Streptomyces nodosus]MBB4794871.1 putative extracellular nuclease [Streptomyces nodosus]